MYKPKILVIDDEKHIRLLYKEELEDDGYDAPIRRTRGADILAACGQLKSESMRQRKSETPAA